MEVGVFGNKRILAIIPARGGSKRIPKKNIIEFDGKPMIAWTIESAIGSKFIDEVVVSTDCEEIQSISIEYGAQVPFLREVAADDHSPVPIATISAIKQSEISMGQFDIVIQLMANCPLRNTEDINNAITMFISKEQTSQISFFKYGWMNPWWANKKNDAGALEFIFKEALNKRSQDLDDLYCPTGAIWISDIELLKKSKTFYSEGYGHNIISWTSALDIDDYDDFEMARAIRYLSKKKN